MAKKMDLGFRSYPHAMAAKTAADCRPEEEEAREYAAGVHFKRGSSAIPDAYDDVKTSRSGKYPVKPRKNNVSRKGQDTIRRRRDIDEEER